MTTATPFVLELCNAFSLHFLMPRLIGVGWWNWKSDAETGWKEGKGDAYGLLLLRNYRRSEHRFDAWRGRMHVV